MTISLWSQTLCLMRRLCRRHVGVGSARHFCFLLSGESASLGFCFLVGLFFFFFFFFHYSVNVRLVMDLLKGKGKSRVKTALNGR